MTFLARGSLVVTLVAPGLATGLAGCGLLDLVGGPRIDDALEYLPATTVSVEFADRLAMAERFGMDDIDPRDVSDEDIDDYQAVVDEDDTAVARTLFTNYLDELQDAPLNEFDIEWEAQAFWSDGDGDGMGDDDGDDGGAATVWKVGDEVDFDALVEDLEDEGYAELPIEGMYGVDAGDTGSYPMTMSTVLLDEDEQIVASTIFAFTDLQMIVNVIADDTASLADDGGGMRALLDLAEDDLEYVSISREGIGVCTWPGRRVPPKIARRYDDLGRPEERAFFVSGDEAQDVLLVLAYDSEDAAETDLEARTALIESGADPRSRTPFAELGDFEIERDGDLLLIEEDYEDGPVAAYNSDWSYGGPGFCVPEER